MSENNFDDIQTLEINSYDVCAWFRGRVDSVAESLARITQYRVLPADVQAELIAATGACQRASHLLHKLGKQ